MSDFNDKELESYFARQVELRAAKGATPKPEVKPGMKQEQIDAAHEDYAARLLGKDASKVTADEARDLADGIAKWARDNRRG
ncbi:MAG: hypothetical protein WBW33_18745 [Bryobacteraceae bacterium]